MTADWSAAYAAWASVVVTICAAGGAVWGAFWLWTHQQAERSKQMRQVGMALFNEVYLRLLDLETMTDFDRHREFIERAAPGTVLRFEPKQQWLLHHAAVTVFLEASIVSAEAAAKNFSVIYSNLGDIEPEKMVAAIRLSAFVEGVPYQLRLLLDDWKEISVLTAAASLSEVKQKLLRRSIGGMAFFLSKLDGQRRSRSAEYLPIYEAQEAMRARAAEGPVERA